MAETSVMKVYSERTELKKNLEIYIKYCYCVEFGHMRKDCGFYKEFFQKKKTQYTEAANAANGCQETALGENLEF